MNGATGRALALALAEARQPLLAEWAHPSWGPVGGTRHGNRALRSDENGLALAVRAKGHWHTAIVHRGAAGFVRRDPKLLRQPVGGPRAWIDRLGKRLQEVEPHGFAWAHPPAVGRWRVPFGQGLLLVDFDRHRVWSYQDWDWVMGQGAGAFDLPGRWRLDQAGPGFKGPEAARWVRRLWPSLSDAERAGWHRWGEARLHVPSELTDPALHRPAPPRLAPPPPSHPLRARF